MDWFDTAKGFGFGTPDTRRGPEAARVLPYPHQHHLTRLIGHARDHDNPSPPRPAHPRNRARHRDSALARPQPATPLVGHHHETGDAGPTRGPAFPRPAPPSRPQPAPAPATAAPRQRSSLTLPGAVSTRKAQCQGRTRPRRGDERRHRASRTCRVWQEDLEGQSVRPGRRSVIGHSAVSGCARRQPGDSRSSCKSSNAQWSRRRRRAPAGMCEPADDRRRSAQGLPVDRVEKAEKWPRPEKFKISPAWACCSGDRI